MHISTKCSNFVLKLKFDCMMKRYWLAVMWLCCCSTLWAWVPARRVAGDMPARRVVSENALGVQARTMTMQTTQVIGSVHEWRKIPVIIVNYANMPLRTSRAMVDSMFNAQGAYTESTKGSVSAYFNDQSMGKYKPQFDIYGPITVAHSYDYYGSNSRTGKRDGRVGELVAEACAIMDDSLDFAEYDLNNDNKVDLLYILYAGPGESDEGYIDTEWIPLSSIPNLIWPHCHNLTLAGTGGLSRVFDGKTIDLYEVSAELDGVLSNATEAHLCGIGLACHEFCHGLGLPDLYTTNGTNHKTLGTWDVMDYGVYNDDMMTPPNLSAYERWYMGWLDPILLNEPQNVTLEALGSSNTAYILSATGQKPADVTHPNPSTFYMLENRQQTSWDAAVPGHGLLLTKITWTSSKWSENTINDVSSDMGVDLIEADRLAPSFNPDVPDNGYFGKQGDAYPYQETDSIMVLPQYPITDIREVNGVITFSFMGGGASTLLHEHYHNPSCGIKQWHDGRVVILRGGKKYDLLGNTL